MTAPHCRSFVLLVSLLCGPVGGAQDPGPAEGSGGQAGVQEVEATPALLRLQVGSHVRLELPREVVRLAVGNEEAASAELLSSQELLLLGLAPGTSSLLLWYVDGETEAVRLEVEPDLGLLRETLAELDPSLTVDAAPGGRVLLLRGEVAETWLRDAAEEAARAFLEGSSEGEEPVLGTGEEPAAAPAEGRARRGGSDAVLNLVRVRNLPVPLEERLREALVPVAGEGVTVRRVLQGARPDDALDLFVLEGKVPDQVTLSRVLFLASRVVAPGSGGQSEIRALADESGALAVQVNNAMGAVAGGGGGGGMGQGGLNLIGGGGGGAPTLNANQPLLNRIGTNLGRAKVHEAAGGRVLSMIEVESLPLVRVDLRLYEVNLGRLRQWRADLGAAWSDFDQQGLPPGALAERFQGDLASGVAQDEIQNVLGFLDGGLSNQLQLVSGGVSLDGIFQLLVEQDVARSLSRPTLTVLSGELALFQVGGQVPIPVAVTLGGGTDQVLSGVEYRPYGIQLAVRPLVEERDRDTITLDVSPLVSLPDLDLTAAIGAATGNELGAAAFETRGTRTHARLLDGESLVLGGLISREEAEAVSKAPWLGDLPGIGWLFRSESAQARETELVIVVNPVIVRPAVPESRLWAFPDTEAILAACLAEVGGAGEARPEEQESRGEEDPEDDGATVPRPE